MAALALFFTAALSMNLILNFALGIKEFVQRERSPLLHIYYPWLILFISTGSAGHIFISVFAFFLIMAYHISTTGTPFYHMTH